MRWPVILSIAVHGAIAALALMQWPSLVASRLPSVDVVPVEIMIGDVTDVRALAPPLPDTEEPPPEEVPPEEAAPTPDAAPPVPPQAARPNQPAQPPLDVSDLRRRLLEDRDETTPGRRRPDNAAPGERERVAAGRSAQETASLEAYFAAVARSHLDRNRCWNDPVDRLDTADFALVVTVNLTDSGAVTSVSAPRVASGARPSQAILDDAQRAPRACSPFPFARDPNGPENYDLWRQMELCFGPACRGN